MNKTQRKTIAEWRAQIDEALETLRSVQSDASDMAGQEQEKFDSLSEGLQQAERGQAIEEAANRLQEIADALDEAVTALETAVSAAEELEG